MTEARVYSAHRVAQAIVEHCRVAGRRLLFISGNGGAGKTELSKAIAQEAGNFGHANIIDMDDFVVDTKLRNSATASWTDITGTLQNGRYTTAFAASYFLQNIKAILYNIEMGNNYYHWPKKARIGGECRLLFGDAVVTIVDGVGTVFLDKDAARSVCIFVQCSKELEIARRIQRARFSNEKDEAAVLKNFDERNSQYKAMIEPHIVEYGLVLESLDDYSLSITRNDYDFPL
jgi:uridine kinase